MRARQGRLGRTPVSLPPASEIAPYVRAALDA